MTSDPDMLRQRQDAPFELGDDTREAFQTLVQPHINALLGLARRLTGDAHWAEDLVQESLVRAYKGITGYRGEGTLRAWLFRIAVRLASEPRRWRRQEPSSSVSDVDIPDFLAPEPERGVLDRELRERIDMAVERLTSRQRSALHLRAVEGLDYTNIADILDCSPGAARMLVLAARKKVLDRVQEYLEP